MTRFARARGSKSSNERLPEKSTSWHVMKQQLQEKLKSSESTTDRARITQKIWKPSDFQDTQDSNDIRWADLEGNTGTDITCASSIVAYEQKNKGKSKKKHVQISNTLTTQTTMAKKKKKKRKDKDSAESDVNYAGENKKLNFHTGACSGIASDGKIHKNKTFKKLSNSDACSVSQAAMEKQMGSNTTSCGRNFNAKNKRKIKMQESAVPVIYKESQKMGCDEDNNQAETTLGNLNVKQCTKKRKRSQSSIFGTQEGWCIEKLESGTKINDKNIVIETCSESEANYKPFEKRKKLHKKKLENNGIGDTVQNVVNSLKPIKQSFQETGTEAVVESRVTQMKRKKQIMHEQNGARSVKKQMYSKVNKVRNKYKHGKQDQQVTIMHFNGRDIAVVKFDGFPVKKEDAENLRKLKKKMIANGIPLNEIQATMKLERRKAEKALARERKKVCFHCRKSGHVLSECPELGKVDNEDPIGSGICFKCGSTEHKHFECRVTREQEFRYAKCFVCNEQGHIARQCTDNPRGLYPKGGACHVCGDVTHLKKDCPDLIKEKEEKTIKLETLSSKSSEALEGDIKASKTAPTKQVGQKKTIKF